MSTLLHIKTSILGEHSQSIQLAERYIAQWQQNNPNGQIIERDLIAEPVPHLDAPRMAALRAPSEPPTAEQAEVIAYADVLLEEIKQADQVVIGLPLYNFGVPSQLKAYFDHLARAGVTFSYTETGPVGLIKGKQVIAFATRGGLYREQGADFQVPFVQQFLGFIGLTDVKVIYAEGLAMGEVADAALSNAHSEIAALA